MVTITNKGQRVLTFIYLLYSEPVGVYPTAISFCAWLDGYESYLGAYPLAFFHGEGLAYGFVGLAVSTPGELAGAVVDNHSQEDVFVDGRLIVYLVLCGGFQRRQHLYLLRISFIGTNAGYLLQLELVAYPLDDKSAVVESHHNDATHLVLVFGGKAQLCGGSELVGRSFLQQQIGHLPEILVVFLHLICIYARDAKGCWHSEGRIVVCVPLPLFA